MAATFWFVMFLFAFTACIASHVADEMDKRDLRDRLRLLSNWDEAALKRRDNEIADLQARLALAQTGTKA